MEHSDAVYPREIASTIDIHDVYHAVKSIKDRQTTIHETIAAYIISDVRKKLKNQKFTLNERDGLYKIRTSIEWYVNRVPNIGNVDVVICPVKLNAELQKRMSGYTVTSATDKIKLRIPYFLVKGYCSQLPFGARVSFGALVYPFAILLDVASIPIVASLRLYRYAQNRFLGDTFKTIVTLSVAQDTFDDIERFKPGGLGYEGARADFEQIVAG